MYQIIDFFRDILHKPWHNQWLIVTLMKTPTCTNLRCWDTCRKLVVCNLMSRFPESVLPFEFDKMYAYCRIVPIAAHYKLIILVTVANILFLYICRGIFVVCRSLCTCAKWHSDILTLPWWCAGVRRSRASVWREVWGPRVGQAVGLVELTARSTNVIRYMM